MRVTLLVDCYLPSAKSAAKQIHDLGAEFLRRGHEVIVLAPSGEVRRDLEVSMEDGLRVARVRTGKLKCATKALRALEEARLPRRLWDKAEGFLRANRSDLLIFYSPTIFLAPLVRKLRALWGCPAYLILRDIFPQWAVDIGILRSGPVLSYFRRKERQQYEAADIIGAQSRGDLEYFARQFPGNHYHLDLLYNWAAADEPGLPRTSYRGMLGLQDKVVFLYGGNLGVAQDMDNIVRLAANVARDPRLHFLIVGDGTAAREVSRSISARGLQNTQILPPMCQQDYLAMVGEFDVGVVTLDRRLKTHNVPGKVLSYLYWGKPVLASINPGNDLFDLLRESQAGLCLVNGQDEGLAAAAFRLANGPSLRAAMGRNSRRLLERTFSVGAAAQRILSHFPGTSDQPERAQAGCLARPAQIAVGGR
jgi:O26-antigen biosynthesis N-acetyl-L-fucosamine transferase